MISPLSSSTLLHRERSLNIDIETFLVSILKKNMWCTEELKKEHKKNTRNWPFLEHPYRRNSFSFLILSAQRSHSFIHRDILAAVITINFSIH